MKLKTKFQDEVFELGEVVNADIATMPDGRIKLQTTAKVGGIHTFYYDKLEEISSDWQDYKESKKHYEILGASIVIGIEDAEDEIFRNQGQREIGNYFETEEEALKAVEKLKAWKRLKDSGFRFDEWSWSASSISDIDIINIKAYMDIQTNFEDKKADLDLLFRGEE